MWIQKEEDLDKIRAAEPEMLQAALAVFGDIFGQCQIREAHATSLTTVRFQADGLTFSGNVYDTMRFQLVRKCPTCSEEEISYPLNNLPELGWWLSRPIRCGNCETEPTPDEQLVSALKNIIRGEIPPSM